MRKWIRTLGAVCGVLFAATVGFWLVGFVRGQVELRRYPVAFAPEIRASAEEYRLNPYMVIAVMRCESTFDPNAVSGVGASGLMQIMPETGAWIAEQLGEQDAYSLERLFDPETNIRYGCWYLRYLCDLFSGDFKLVVCAYNAGQGNVAKWLANPDYAQNGALSVIPFDSTATYYERVETAYARYEALYPALFDEAGDGLPAKEAYAIMRQFSEELPCWK